jgi:hypothetical protein
MTRLARTFFATSRASSPPLTSAVRQVRALFPEERHSVRIEGEIRSRKTRCVDRESNSYYVLRRPRGVLLLPERPQAAARALFGRSSAAHGRRGGDTAGGAKKALVHCHQGVSRSCTLCVAYAMLRLRLPLPDALARVKAARGISNPNPVPPAACLPPRAPPPLSA